MPVMKVPIIRHGNHDHDDEEGNTEGVNVAKAVAMVCLFTASFVLGTVTIKLNKWCKWESNAKNNSYVKLLLCFGGGVLLCTTFIHMEPEIAEGFESLDLDTGNYELPLAELLMCCGFFIMYFVEELVHHCLYHEHKMSAVRNSFSRRTSEKQPHNHSHVSIINNDDKAPKIIRGLFIVLALSVHELFEGLAVGLESHTNHVWYMFGAVSAHKFVIAFCIGVELVTAGLKNFLIVIYVFTFAVVSPMGIGIGMAITNTDRKSTDTASVFLQGLASGTLLYVVFFEILESDRKNGLKQFLAVFAGFVVMCIITIFLD